MLFVNDSKNNNSQLRCEKRFATKAQRHEVEKKQSFFPLCLRVFVAKFNFCKKLLISLLKYMSLAACRRRANNECCSFSLEAHLRQAPRKSRDRQADSLIVNTSKKPLYYHF